MYSTDKELEDKYKVMKVIALVLWTVVVFTFGALLFGSGEAKVEEKRWYTHEDWEVVVQCVSEYPDNDSAAGEKCLGKVLRDGGK